MNNECSPISGVEEDKWPLGANVLKVQYRIKDDMCNALVLF